MKNKLENHNHNGNIIGVIVVEDNDDVRQYVLSYLKDYPQLEIMGEASDGAAAMTLIDKCEPEVVLLDIELPVTNGLAVAVWLRERHPRVKIVFVTGHSSYGAEAFQLDAIDYLVKPVTKEAVQRMVAKIERHFALERSQPSSNARIAVAFNHEMRFVDKADIIYLERQGHHTVFHTAHGDFPSSETLTTWSHKLGNKFFRCQRSFIINTEKIERIFPIADRIYEVSFSGYPSPVTMGRDKYEELCRLIMNIL